MTVDFSFTAIRPEAVGLKPMTFLEPDHKQSLMNVMELIAIESSPRPVREMWQKRQLLNLLNFANERSPFWRDRIRKQIPSGNIDFSAIPVLTRPDVRAQYAAEGSLIRPVDQLEAYESETSGSSGVPVRFFVSSMNTAYNVVRNAAQYFIEGRGFSLNRVQVLASSQNLTDDFVVELAPE